MRIRYTKMKKGPHKGEWGILIQQIPPEARLKRGFVVQVQRKDGQLMEERIKEIVYYNRQEGYAYCLCERGSQHPTARDISLSGQPLSTEAKYGE